MDRRGHLSEYACARAAGPGVTMRESHAVATHAAPERALFRRGTAGD